MRDSTRKAAGVPDRVFSGKDILIPPIGRLRQELESAKARKSYLEEMRDSPDDSHLSYYQRAKSFKKTIRKLQEELAALETEWTRLPQALENTEKDIKRLEKHILFAKHRKQIEKFLRQRAEIEKEVGDVDTDQSGG